MLDTRPTYTLPCVLAMDPAEYHRDEFFDVPTLSASTATTIVTRSPLHAYLRHPRLGNAPRETTPAQERGTLVHSMVLGVGPRVAVIEANDYRTKAAQEARDAAREAGDIPMLSREWDDVQAMVSAIQANIQALGFTLDGESEAVALWEEQSQAGPVKVRGMMDHLFLEQGIVLDLKTCRNAHPSEIAKHMIRYGYDVQWAAYTSALRHLRPDLAGREQMLFLFVESEAPYCVTPCKPDGSMRELGEARWARAVETWSRCLESGRWPAYSDVVMDIAAPAWALQQEEMEGEGFEF